MENVIKLLLLDLARNKSVPDPKGGGREGVGNARVEVVAVVVAVAASQRVEAECFHELGSIALHEYIKTIRLGQRGA